MAAEKVRSGYSMEIGYVLNTIDDIFPKMSESSIAHPLVTALNCERLKETLQKCQRKVTLVNSGTCSGGAMVIHDSELKTELCVSEVKVKPSKHGLDILTEPEVGTFCHNVRGLPRAFLVSSESVSMIEAKLAVYRKFRYNIDGNGIRIHHIFDKPEDFLNHYGHFTIATFQTSVERLIDSIPVAEVRRIVCQASEDAFVRSNIRETCREINLIDKDDHIGTAGIPSYVCRSHFTVRRIKRKLVSETLREIGKTLCNKMFQNIFAHIRSLLEKYISADLQSINFSISGDTFMEHAAYVQVHVVKVIVDALNQIIELVMVVVGVVSNFVWPVNINSYEWRDKVADELYDQVQKQRTKIVEKIIANMKDICEQTRKEIYSTVRELDNAKKHMCHLDQEQIAKEWMFRDIHIEGMENQPTILKIIGGRVGRRIKIKVFLASEDEEVEQFVRENAKNVPDDAKFVFVDTSSKTNKPTLKAKAHSNGQGKRKELYSIVKKEEEKLFAKHSNIIAIGTSLVRQVDQELIEDPCIVIYCLDKEMVPFGEEKLPDKLNGVPCDIREDFLYLGTHVCTDNSHRIVHGCSIGSTQNGQMGSVGFLAHENTNSEFGFLTAAHVALSPTILGDLHEMRSTKIPNLSENGPLHIIHLFKRDGSILSEKIGEVTKSFFGNHEQVGIDAAFVKFTDKQDETLYKRNKEVWDNVQHFPYPIESNVVRREDIDVYDNLKVYKRGIATGVTEGRLNGETSWRVPHPNSEKGYVVFTNCFQIEFSDDDKDVFFDKGDSGSGVFLLVKDTRLQPLAIAFAILKEKRAVAASPLETILSTLDVSI